MHFWVYLFVAVIVECFFVYALSSTCDNGSADEREGAAFGAVILAIVFLLCDAAAIITWIVKHW